MDTLRTLFCPRIPAHPPQHPEAWPRSMYPQKAAYYSHRYRCRCYRCCCCCCCYRCCWCCCCFCCCCCCFCCCCLLAPDSSPVGRCTRLLGRSFATCSNRTRPLRRRLRETGLAPGRAGSPCSCTSAAAAAAARRSPGRGCPSSWCRGRGRWRGRAAGPGTAGGTPRGSTWAGSRGRASNGRDSCPAPLSTSTLINK